MMKEILPRVEIDEQAKDELRPPCGADKPGEHSPYTPCAAPAEWICHVKCPRCGPTAALTCTRHMGRLASGADVAHGRCRRSHRDFALLTLLSVEPLHGRRLVMRTYSVYIAAPYIARDALRQYARELSTVGIGCTSTWLLSDAPVAGGTGTALGLADDGAADAARECLADVDRADAIVQFTGLAIEALRIPAAVGPSLHSGGRHIELGYALARNKDCIVVGPAENIFQRALCTVVPDWRRALVEIVRLSRPQDGAA